MKKIESVIKIQSPIIPKQLEEFMIVVLKTWNLLMLNLLIVTYLI